MKILFILALLCFQSASFFEVKKQYFNQIEQIEDKYLNTRKNYKLVKLSQDNGAKCLDGSPPSIYVKQDKFETNPDKFIFYFQGGGWCYGDTEVQTIQDCVERSKTKTGTSDILPENNTLQGIFDEDPAKNPYYHDYTVIYINYCDGSGFQGYFQDPIYFDSQTIWFRGERNTLETLRYAKEVLGMDKASEVLVTGSSAGGLAAYTWIDYIANDLKKTNPNVYVYGQGDGSLFLDFENYETQEHNYQLKMRNLLRITNFEANIINKSCANAYPGENWKCMFSQYLLYHIESDIQMLNSVYDSWALPNIAGINCIVGQSLENCSEEQMQYIQLYRQSMIDLVNDLFKSKPNFSTWLISCVNHTFIWTTKFTSKNWRVPEQSDWSIDYSLMKSQGGEGDSVIRQIDSVEWPGNAPCS